MTLLSSIDTNLFLASREMLPFVRLDGDSKSAKFLAVVIVESYCECLIRHVYLQQKANEY